MATLSSTVILSQTLDSFKTLFPYVADMATDFTDRELVLNRQEIAHIATLPTASSFDTTTGYANGATEASSLLVDIPVTPDVHGVVPIKVSHLTSLAQSKQGVASAVAGTGYVFGKTLVDSITAKFTGANLSYSETATTANSDLDVVEAITTTLNGNGCPPMGRIGLVNSAVAQTMALDTRIASKDYYGALTGSTGLRVFRGVGGFDAIYEYPGLSANNATGQAFTAATTDICTAAGHGLETGDRVRLTTTDTLPAGLAVSTTYYVIKLTADTFKLASSDANATAGTAVDVTDTGTGTHTVTGYENVSGIFGSLKTAIALLTGIPAVTNEIAAQFNIPVTMPMESMRDPVNGFAMALVKWQAQGTANLHMAATGIWGSSVGRQAGAAGSITDKGAVLLRTA